MDAHLIWTRRLAPPLALVACITWHPEARATATPDAERVIRRYLEATGGAAAMAAESTSHSISTVEGFGFSGSVETWTKRPDHELTRTELGPFKLSEGTDGVSPWRTDPTTGRYVRLTDRDSLEAAVATWFGLERWAEPGQGGGDVTVASHEKDSLGTYTVLSVSAPRSGDLKPRRLWFSDQTGLNVREESAKDQAWVVTTASDWRLAAGRMRPFETTSGISTMPANRLRTRMQSVEANVDVSNVAFAMPDSVGGNALRWLKTPGVATLPFEYRARHVWLRASINGGPEKDFLFDTGASVTVIDSAFAVASGLKAQGYMQATGAGAAGSASFTTLGSLEVRAADGDGVELRDLKVATMSVVPMFSRYFWREFAGVIGYDLISRFVTTIDYDGSRIVLHDPKTFRFAGVESPLPMKLNGIVPSLECVVDGRWRGDFRLDVGSSSTVDLHAPFAKKNGIEASLRDRHEVSGAGFGGQFTSTLGRLHTMAIGPYAWRDPMVTVSNATEGAFASEEFAGNIGNRILERFRVTLDYEGRRVWLEPGARYGSRDSFTRTGLMLGWSPEKVDAITVLRGSPAEKAGVREGDRVVSVDGRAIGDWDLKALDALLENGPDGRKVRLTVNRAGADHDLVLVEREMLK